MFGDANAKQGSEAMKAKDTYWQLAEEDQRSNDIIVQPLGFNLTNCATFKTEVERSLANIKVS